jgi:predicted methyltransferase
MYRTIAIIIGLLTTHLLAGIDFADEALAETKAFSSLPTALMEDPRRIEWQQPEKVVAHLQLRKGDVVADIGAGTGYFTQLFAKSVGKTGTVFALDVDEILIQALALRAKKESLPNIKAILTPPNDPLLAMASTDLIFLCDTHVFIEQRKQYLVRLRESLKPDGRLAIISFNMNPEIPGAPPRLKRVSREQTIQEAEQAGFALEAEYFFLPHQYFLVFGKRAPLKL